ncbi:hypothetical protein [Mycobacterium sp.]|uniref:hypothetical protein n=1 Tax=Mycobacterium sp. TaxID=1785 RepID=UPI002CED264E|nr:hypothetical protein [Mycobacterium sp.]HTQ16504.1 hypothetical protein [Mycobacterium sp.]
MFDFAKSAKLIAGAMLGGAAVFCSAVDGPPATGDPGTLMSMLPQGFTSSNCHQEAPKPPALERVSCDQSSESDGPSGAKFASYGNVDDLATGFQNVKINLASTCPGDQVSPGPWGYGSGEKNGGLVECGTIDGDSNTTVPVVLWTDKSKLRLAQIKGSDISNLYQWWRTKSG